MSSSDMVFQWRKSSRSGGNGSCVELGRAEWRESGRGGQCGELASAGAIRDSKNPSGPVLRVELAGFLNAVKAAG